MVGEVTRGSVQAGHAAGLAPALACLAWGHLRKWWIDYVPSSFKHTWRCLTWWFAKPFSGSWTLSVLTGGSQCAQSLGTASC